MSKQTDYTLSISAANKAEAVEKLNELKHPDTDAPCYADFCHVKQHAIDFVSRCSPTAGITLEVTGTRNGRKSNVQLSFIEDDQPK